MKVKTARRLDLIPAPRAEVCTACRQAPDHGAQPGDWSSIIGCERCGCLIHDRCYWREVAPAAEARAFWEDDAAADALAPGVMRTIQALLGQEPVDASSPAERPYAFVCWACRA